MLRSVTAGLAAALLALAAPVNAQQRIKIGFITTLSGPPAIIGKHMKDSVDLALDHLGHKMGGNAVEVIYGDDQFKPEVGVQLDRKSTRLNSSHANISYAVFCLKKKKRNIGDHVHC